MPASGRCKTNRAARDSMKTTRPPQSGEHAAPSPPVEVPGSRPTRRLLTREDQEFLPAALEILETPPSPIRMQLISVLTGFVAVALAWSFFGRLEVIAIAQGKVQPPGRVKVVQPTETGKVTRIAHVNGDRVNKDEVLVEFDATDARADREALEALVFALKAETARRDAVLRAVDPARGLRDQTPPVAWPAGLPEATRQREAQVMAADLAQVAAALAALDAQQVQRSRERDRLKETITAQDALVTTQRERVTMRSSLATSGFGTRSSLLDSREALQKEETTLTAYKGQLAEAAAAIEVIGRERARTLQTFIAENTQKRADAMRALDESQQKLAKSLMRLENMTLRAPADGLVQASSVHTLGQVLGAGQEIMRIVPDSDVLEVEAYLPNKDIGFVREGQEVSVKIDSFPYTRYGMITGTVTRIAYDAIPQQEASQIEANPARPGESQGFAGAQRTQNLVFPITILLSRRHIVVDGQRIPVTPGMTVVAEIKTGSRRIIEYLVAPVYEVTSESLRER